MGKVCTKCRFERPETDFCRRGDRPGNKRKSICRICENLASKDRYQRNKDEKLAQKRENYHQGQLYGLTKEQLDEMYERQNHRCIWCKREVKLQIHHDRKTNEVVSLMCQNCNTAEGTLKHWPEAIEALDKLGLEN